jgi:hypothetical protein
MNEELKSTLVTMVEEENHLKAELASDGSLYEGYPVKIRELHLNQANELERIVETYGWPKISQVGKEGADAAWLILQHSISRPDFMKRCFPVFESAVQENEARSRHLACLTDGIRYFSREPQVYGSYFDWNEKGQLCPWVIEDPENVNERRKKMGLNTLEERIKEIERDVRKNNLLPPKDYLERQSEMNQFLKEVCWIA